MVEIDTVVAVPNDGTLMRPNSRLLPSVALLKAVPESNCGTSRNHAVPSFAIEQSRVPMFGIGQKRFLTLAVFGVLV